MDSAIMTHKGKMVMVFQYCFLLYPGERELVSVRGEQVFGSLDVLFVHQNIKVAELPECKVPIHESSERWSFEWESRNPMCLKQMQDPQQFPGQEKIVPSIPVEMLPQLFQSSRGDSFWAHGTKMLIEERHHTVLECGLREKGPVKVLLEQGADPLRIFSIHASTSTTE
jgi:hypothetical protein